MLPDLREPWRSFLHDVDASLNGAVAVHCLGGFVVTAHTMPEKGHLHGRRSSNRGSLARGIRRCVYR